MCTDLHAINVLHRLLKQKRRWCLDVCTPDVMGDIGEKALFYADKRLGSISFILLWRRYKKWRKSEVRECDKYFEEFLSQVAFDITMDYLTGIEKLLFQEICYFNFKFI